MISLITKLQTELYMLATPQEAIVQTGRLNGCEAVRATRGTAKGLLDNVVNLYKEFGPWIGIILIVIGAVASMGNKGPKWFSRAAIVIGILLILPGLTTMLNSIGGSPC